MANKILYVEDDLTLSFVTKDNLELKGYSIVHCEDGQKALEVFENNKFDLCILDVMLPKLDGYALAEKIREKDHEVPILFLTAKSAKDDRIHGLRIGGDDYITKPFSIEELILKIEIFLKRSKINPFQEKSGRIYKIGKYEFNIEEYTLKNENYIKRLTQQEAGVLKLFFENQGTVLKRADILKTLWGDDNYFAGRSLDVFISRLRKYLSEDDKIKIENIHGVGFKFVC